MSLLTQEHKAWIGSVEESMEVEITRRDICKYAAATDQQLDKYLRGDEAPPMFVFNLFTPIVKLDDLRQDGLPRSRQQGPKLPLKRIMAGGTEIKIFQPIRPGQRLRGERRIDDMYEKEGRTGPLIFTVRKLHVTDAAGATVLEEIQTSIAR